MSAKRNIIYVYINIIYVCLCSTDIYIIFQATFSIIIFASTFLHHLPVEFDGDDSRRLCVYIYSVVLGGLVYLRKAALATSNCISTVLYMLF